jgi:hypothetical protein
MGEKVVDRHWFGDSDEFRVGIVVEEKALVDEITLFIDRFVDHPVNERSASRNILVSSASDDGLSKEFLLSAEGLKLHFLPIPCPCFFDEKSGIATVCTVDTALLLYWYVRFVRPSASVSTSYNVSQVSTS